MKKLLLCTILALSGCSPTPEEVAAAQAATSLNASNPEKIMTLPDGRPVNRIRVVRPGSYDHFVYYIDNAQVTTNYSQQNGKSTYNRVLVTLPLNPTAEQVLAEAKRLEKEQAEVDAAEYKRLKEKFGGK